MHVCRDPLHCILPPYIIDRLAESEDPRVRRNAQDTIAASAAARAVRAALSAMPGMSVIPSPGKKKHRLVYDNRNRGSSDLPGTLARDERKRTHKDAAVNEAYNFSGYTYDFYYRLFGRNSLDDNGMSLISSVHLGRNLNNAFWDGEQMSYGDGDGKIFVRFSRSLDVVAHELTHGVVTHTCNLIYRNEPGALNEHFADVMGILVRQWKRKQTVTKSDWTIGPDIMGAETTATCLRTFKNELAYEDDPLLGTDPQPKHMRDRYRGTGDYGGVHINSGIPNHAFYLFAMKIGGRAWERPGRIWYDTMQQLNRYSDFRDMADMTVQIAGGLYGANGQEEKALVAAWKAVGL